MARTVKGMINSFWVQDMAKGQKELMKKITFSPVSTLASRTFSDAINTKTINDVI